MVPKHQYDHLRLNAREIAQNFLGNTKTSKKQTDRQHIQTYTLDPLFQFGMKLRELLSTGCHTTPI